MSIDFATLQGLSIPEGVVTQIVDASGRKLWSAAPAMCTVTVTHDAYDAQYFWTSCSAVVDGQTIWLGEGTYELPIGTVITCEGGAYFSQSSSASMKIYLNEQVVAGTSYYSERNHCSYDYTLSKNITIDPRTDKTFTYDNPNKFGAIYITEQ